MRNLSFEDSIRFLGRVFSRIMLTLGILVFVVSLVWTLINNYLKTFGINNMIWADLGHWIAVIGIPCIGMAFIGYSLLSRIIGLRVVLLIAGISILVYYGLIFNVELTRIVTSMGL